MKKTRKKCTLNGMLDEPRRLSLLSLFICEHSMYIGRYAVALNANYWSNQNLWFKLPLNVYGTGKFVNASHVLCMEYSVTECASPLPYSRCSIARRFNTPHKICISTTISLDMQNLFAWCIKACFQQSSIMKSFRGLFSLFAQRV